MAAIKSTITDILKEMYEGRLEEQRNTFDKAWDRAPKRTIGPGETHTFAARHGRATSWGFQTETATLRTPDVQKQTQLSYVMKESYATVRLSWRVMRLARTEPAVFADKLQDEFSGMEIDVLDGHELVLCNDGSGTLATQSGAFDHGTTAGDAHLTLTDPEDARKFHVGMVLEVWSGATGSDTQRVFLTATNTATVSAVTDNSGSIEVFLAEDLSANTDTIVDGDLIARSGTRTAATRLEPMGVYGIADDGNPMPDTEVGAGLHGQVVASNPWWTGYVDGNSAVNRPLTSKLMEDLCDAIMIRSGRHPTEFWMPYGVRSAFGNEQQAQRRTVNTFVIKGGTQPGFQDDSNEDYITFKGKPMVPLKYARQNTLVALENSCWVICREGKMEWVDDDGATLSRTPDRQPAFEAVLASLWELKCKQRNAFGRIDDLIGDDPVAF